MSPERRESKRIVVHTSICSSSGRPHYARKLNSSAHSFPPLFLMCSRVKNCSVFVPIISEESAKSPKLLARVEDAAGHGKVICPVILSTFTLPAELQRVRGLMHGHATVGHAVECKGRGQQLAFPRSFEGLAELVNGRYFPLLRDGGAADQLEHQKRIEEEEARVARQQQQQQSRWDLSLGILICA